MALVATVALALAAAGAAASLLIRPKPPSAVAPPGIAPVRIALPPAPPAPAATQTPISVANLKRPMQAAPGRESYAAELRLLQRAQAAYAERDLAGALALAAEHGRRFPNGRLAEEREALRVRSLAAAGRGTDARRAVAAFARRFPHSVLLPRLQETSAMAE
jgi:TolA-binding protein